MRTKTGKLYKVGTGLNVSLPAEWIKELNITEKSIIEKFLINGLIIISPKKISAKKIKQAVEILIEDKPKSKTVLETTKTPVIQFNSMLPRVAETNELEPYKTEARQVLDINFTYEEKLTIKTAFLYAEKEGMRVPEENSSNLEILELLERAFNNCTFPYELSGKIQKILKKYL